MPLEQSSRLPEADETPEHRHCPAGVYRRGAELNRRVDGEVNTQEDNAEAEDKESYCRGPVLQHIVQPVSLPGGHTTLDEG